MCVCVCIHSSGFSVCARRRLQRGYIVIHIYACEWDSCIEFFFHYSQLKTKYVRMRSAVCVCVNVWRDFRWIFVVVSFVQTRSHIVVETNNSISPLKILSLSLFHSVVSIQFNSWRCSGIEFFDFAHGFSLQFCAALLHAQNENANRAFPFRRQHFCQMHIRESVV